MPGYKRVAVDSMGRVLGDDSEVAASAGDTLVTSIDAKVQSVAEKSLHQAMMTARKTFDPVTHRNYVADSGAVVVMDAHNGRVVAMSSQPTYDPKQWVGGISSKQLKRLYSAKAGQPAAVPGDTGPVRSGLDLEAADGGDGAQQRLRREHAAGLLERGPGRQPLVQELRVRVVRADHVRPGAADLLRHVLLPGRAEVLVAVRHGPAQRGRQGPAGLGGQGLRDGQPDRHRHPGGVERPDRRPALEAVVLEGDEGLLLQDRQEGFGDGLPPGLRARVLPRGQPVPPGRRGQLLDRPGRHPGHAGPARPRLRGALQRRHALRAPRGQGRRLADGQGDQEDPAEGAGPREGEEGRAALRRQRAEGHAPGRHARLEVHRLPAGQGQDPRQDRLGRGLRQAEHLVGRDVHEGLRGGDDGDPGRHRLGHVGSLRAQDLGVALRHQGHGREAEAGRDPGHHAARRAARVRLRRLDPPAEGNA